MSADDNAATVDTKKGALQRIEKTANSTELVDMYVKQHSLRLHPCQEKLIEITKGHELNSYMSSADQIQFLANLLRSIGARKLLEIGTYTGYSTMSFAMALPHDGKVIACDICEEYANLGKPVWKEAGVFDKIDLRIAPAIETLNSIIASGEEGSFDFAFIDANKNDYWSYYEKCLQLLRKGGIIAVDNVIWNGKVFDENFTDASTMALRDFNKRLFVDERVDISMLKCGDGTSLAFKR